MGLAVAVRVPPEDVTLVDKSKDALVLFMKLEPLANVNEPPTRFIVPLLVTVTPVLSIILPALVIVVALLIVPVPAKV